MIELKPHNGQAKPQQVYGITITQSNIDTATEPGKTVTPAVGLSAWLCCVFGVFLKDKNR